MFWMFYCWSGEEEADWHSPFWTGLTFLCLNGLDHLLPEIGGLLESLMYLQQIGWISYGFSVQTNWPDSVASEREQLPDASAYSKLGINCQDQRIKPRMRTVLYSGRLGRRGCQPAGRSARGCLPRGDVHLPPPCEQNSWHMLVKILPFCNFCRGR